MAVFGKSLFETVLESLPVADIDDEPVVTPRVRGLNGGFVGREWSGREDGGADLAALFERFEPQKSPPPPPVWLNRLSEEEIAEDLALHTCRTADAVREKRRSFARTGHPDRVSAEFRNAANRRMTVANQLIDAELERRERK